MSEVRICNLALVKLGAQKITSLGEDSKPAELCGLFYEPMRDEVLRGYPWNFAKARAVLARLSTTPPFGYGHEYQLPTDCLKVLRLTDPETAYSVEGNKLLTDEDNAYLTYTRKVTDPTLFDASFVNALAARLAMELCTALAPRASLKEALRQEYYGALANAARQDAQENVQAVLTGNPWFDARS